MNLSTALIDEKFPPNPEAPRLIAFIPDEVRRHPFIDYDSFVESAYHFKIIFLLFCAQVCYCRGHPGLSHGS